MPAPLRQRTKPSSAGGTIPIPMGRSHPFRTLRAARAYYPSKPPFPVVMHCRSPLTAHTQSPFDFFLFRYPDIAWRIVAHCSDSQSGPLFTRRWQARAKLTCADEIDLQRQVMICGEGAQRADGVDGLW